MASGGASILSRPKNNIIPKTAPTKNIGNKGAQSTTGQKSSGGSKSPAANNFGLNLNDKTAFNPLNPDVNTVGGFNKLLLQESQPQYLPQLQGLQGQVSAENAANKQRSGDIGSIYSQYQGQAQDAYNQVQKALADLASNTAPGTSQANLGAALASAVGGQNSLAQMMGVSAPSTQQATLPYMGAAQAASTGTQDELNSAGAGAIGLQGANLENVGNEQATEQNTESLRHGAAIQGVDQQIQALKEQIPGIISAQREKLISDLQNAQSLNFQEGLANKQFGLSQSAQNFNQAQTTAQFGETQKNDAANRAATYAQINQNAQQLKINEQQVNNAAATALATAQGKAAASAVKFLQGALLPTKQQLKTVTNADGSKQTVLANPGQWHVDTGSLLKTMMDQYGISQAQALQMMTDLGASTPISGQGGQTVGQWAATYNQRLNQQRTKKLQAGATPLVLGNPNSGAGKTLGNIPGVGGLLG